MATTSSNRRKCLNGARRSPRDDMTRGFYSYNNVNAQSQGMTFVAALAANTQTGGNSTAYREAVNQAERFNAADQASTINDTAAMPAAR